MNLKDIFKIIWAPVILLGSYLLVFIVWKLFHLPDGAELVALTGGYFEKYGLWLLFFGALLEGFLILGNYFPGGFIIFLGVVTANGNIPRIILVVTIVSLAFFISYTLNYLVGRYGWYRLLERFGMKNALEKAAVRLEKRDLSTVMLSYWDPNLASITATAAGILKLPLPRFLLVSAIGIVLWNSFWGTAVSIMGDKALSTGGLGYIFLVIGIWIAVLLIKHYRKNKIFPIEHEAISDYTRE